MKIEINSAILNADYSIGTEFICILFYFHGVQVDGRTHQAPRHGGAAALLRNDEAGN